MKQSGKTMRKMLAVALAAATIGSVGILTEVGTFVGTNITANAANYELHTYNNITYALYSDGTAEAVSYSGTNKDFSASTFSIPSVIYAKNLGKDYILNYSQFTVTRLQADGFSGIKAKIFSLPNSLQVLFSGFRNTEIGIFTISTNNSYFSTSNGYLSNKSGNEIVAYPTKPSLYYTGSNFISIPSTVTRIGNFAFTGYKATSITIPSSVTYVGNAAFEYSSLQSITFEGNPSFYKATGDSVCSFDNASSLSGIKIKGTSGNYSTDSYGMLYNKDKTKFIYCPLGRTSAFNIADTCTEIVDWAFHNSNAKPVIYENVKTISSIAFDGVKSGFKLYCLKNTPIETYAKNNHINYGYHFEYSANSDGTLTVTKYSGPYSSPSLPGTVNGKTIASIGAEAFKGNTSLSGIYLSSTQITSIGEKAFSDCTSLKNIYLPSTVTNIGKEAFYNTAATSITIPSNMTLIGERAFYGMFKLEKVTIPGKVKTIGQYAFGFDSALTSVTIPDNVTSVGFAAFYGCKKLTGLTIGSGVTSISSAAFCNTGLTSQHIPQNLTSIGSYAFGYTYSNDSYTRDENFTQISGYPGSAAETYCKNYNIPFQSVLQYSTSSDGKSIKIDKYTGKDTIVVIPDKIDGLPVTSIAGYAFNGTPVTSITLPGSMTKLDGYALYGASKLTTVKFPSGLVSIGSYAFEFCSSLKSITIPNTVTSIANGAFYGCTALTSVNLGTGMKTISPYAFENTALKSVSIPKSVTYIGDYAFGDTWANSTHTPVDGFQITGYAYTEAETYANNNSITFNPLYENIVNTSTISKTAITLGESIKINFSSTGGKKPMKYSATYSLSGSSVSICSYSTNTSASFTPNQAGTYTIYTYAKDDRGYSNTKNFTLTVTKPVSNTSTINKTTVTVGDSVTITASATGGTGNYTYTFAYTKDNSGYWTNTAAAGNTCTFTPNYAGNYQYKVIATDSSGKTSEKIFNVTVRATLDNHSYIASQALKPSENVQLHLSATGGDGNYTYTVEYERIDIASGWITAYQGTNSDVSFKLPSVGEYFVSINVTDGTGNYENMTYNVVVKEADLANESTMSADTIALGKKVTLTGKASGGFGNYQYSFLYKKKSDTKWVNKQNFDTNNTVKLTPAAAVDYDICIKVKDSGGIVEKKFFTLHVAEPLANTSKLSATSIGKGQAVTVNASGANGVGSYLYGVYYKNRTQSKWTTKQDFSNNNVIEVKPANTGTYDICVKVKDASGTIAKVYFEVNVSKAVASNSTISATEIKKGESVTVKAAAKGGIAPYTYSVLYKQHSNSKWTVHQDFSSNNTIVVTPGRAAVYDICVKVQDGNGTVGKQYFTVTVK